MAQLAVFALGYICCGQGTTLFSNFRLTKRNRLYYGKKDPKIRITGALTVWQAAEVGG